MSISGASAHLGAQPVAEAAHRLHHVAGAGLAQLLADVADVDV